METLNKIFTDKEAEDVAEKVLASVRDKIKEQIGDSIYTHLSGFLYEHYTNHKEKIREELIREITEEFVNNPSSYVFSNLRKKLWQENKVGLTATLTDEAIKNSVEKIIHQYTHKEYPFSWQWKDAIVKIILENWDSFKDDGRINAAFGRELDRRQNYITHLEQKLREISQEADLS